MGFKTYCFAAQYDEIRRFFMIFDIALGCVGAVALMIAAMGIINTMVMSVVERRREIGILKSLGADDGDIRWLFIAESGMIGVIGSAIGVVIGWVVTIIATFVGRIIIAEIGEADMEQLKQFQLFVLPVWLIFVAIAFGTVVSLIAGLYPSSRAASVDPVKALRNE